MRVAKAEAEPNLFLTPSHVSMELVNLIYASKG